MWRVSGVTAVWRAPGKFSPFHSLALGRYRLTCVMRDGVNPFPHLVLMETDFCDVILVGVWAGHLVGFHRYNHTNGGLCSHSQQVQRSQLSVQFIAVNSRLIDSHYSAQNVSIQPQPTQLKVQHLFRWQISWTLEWRLNVSEPDQPDCQHEKLVKSLYGFVPQLTQLLEHPIRFFELSW